MPKKAVTIPEDRDLIMCGDNLEAMQRLPAECIDLCYADPPFFTQKEWRAFGKEGRELYNFKDSWDTIEDYLAFMEARVKEIHRVLKPTGSFYLHCDWHASHYLKVMCDRAFGGGDPGKGRALFRNEIVWFYPSMSAAKEHFPRKHDAILFYTKGEEYTFNGDDVREAYDEKTVRRYENDVIFPGGYEAKMNPKGRLPYDVWQIPPIRNVSAEKVGYPTQKPLALLERIIKASSNKGDLVLDPFAGSGTTAYAAHTLDRRYVAIELLPGSARVIEDRIYSHHYGETEDQNAMVPKQAIPEIIGMPRTVDELIDMPEDKFYKFVRDEMDWESANLPNSCFRARLGRDYVKIVQPAKNSEAASIQDLTDLVEEMSERFLQAATLVALDFTEAALRKIEKHAETYGIQITPMLLGKPREIADTKVEGFGVLVIRKPEMEVDLSKLAKGKVTVTANVPDGDNIMSYSWYLDERCVDNDYPSLRSDKESKAQINLSVLEDKGLLRSSRLRVVACTMLGGKRERRISLR